MIAPILIYSRDIGGANQMVEVHRLLAGRRSGGAVPGPMQAMMATIDPDARAGLVVVAKDHALAHWRALGIPVRAWTEIAGSSATGERPVEAWLDAIAPLAAKGLRTTGTLIAIFGNTSDAALDAERVARADGWWERLWAGFMGLISTRSTGEVKGASTEARLARAGERMKAGDLAAAVKELRSISGAAREPLREWLAEADARVKLEATLAEVNTSAIQSLMAPGAGSEPVPQLPEP